MQKIATRLFRATSISRKASLSDVVRELRELRNGTNETNRQLRELRNDTNERLGETKRLLFALNKELKGFSGNIAKATEGEITEAVKQQLIRSGSNVKDVTLNFKVRDKNQLVLAECDGLIVLQDKLVVVVVEAKSSAGEDSVNQLQRVCQILSQQTG